MKIFKNNLKGLSMSLDIMIVLLLGVLLIASFSAAGSGVKKKDFIVLQECVIELQKAVWQLQNLAMYEEELNRMNSGYVPDEGKRDHEIIEVKANRKSLITK